MIAPSLPDGAELFHRLHDSVQPLILVNAWDAGSARVIEQAGAKAIATTSAGVAWSLGYRDGEHAPPRDIVDACARICRAVRVPVSVDIERGFGRATGDVSSFVQALIQLGIAGINIEDGVLPGGQQLAPPEILCARIAVVRDVAHRSGVRLFINARTDTYLVPTNDAAAQFEETVRRATMYISAGADGIFAPGLDLQYVVRFVRSMSVPVNIYAGGGWEPPVHALVRTGVRRISLGCGPVQAVFGLLRRVTKEAIGRGSWSAMNNELLPVSEINGLFSLTPEPLRDAATGQEKSS